MMGTSFGSIEVLETYEKNVFRRPFPHVDVKLLKNPASENVPSKNLGPLRAGVLNSTPRGPQSCMS